MSEKKKGSKLKFVVGGLVGIIGLFLLISWFNSPAIGTYKKESAEYTWDEFYEGEVDGGIVVKITGEIDKAHSETMTLLDDEGGIYFIKDEDETGASFEDGDIVTVYGPYVGDDSKTGFPKIIARVIEN